LLLRRDGNIGFNTTDIESWHSNYKAIEGPTSSIMFDYASGVPRIYISANAYLNTGGSWKYKVYRG